LAAQDMLTYRNKFIRILECWDKEQPDSFNVDLVRLFQQPKPIDGTFCRDFYTILINLDQNEQDLFNRIKKDTRYDIRRGHRDCLVYELINGKDAFDEFCDFYDLFAERLKQPKIRRPWLRLLAESNSLRLSKISEERGQTLIWHGYHHSDSRVTLLYSAALSPLDSTSGWRAKLGRANRFQHWQDFLRFKQERISLYDFGGWYEGKNDQKRLQINRFKEEFGGDIVRNFICERALTWRGALFLRLRQTLLGNAI
jgi:hypothetical protein